MKYLNCFIIAILVCVFFSCSKSNTPEPLEVKSPVNMKASAAISDKYGIFIGESEFCVNVPESGDYHLKYVTETKKDTKTKAKVDTFNLIFHVQDSALIYISLDSLMKSNMLLSQKLFYQIL